MFKNTINTLGMTYGNECTLKAKACKNPNFRLEVASNGECLSKSFQLNEEENSSWKIKSNIKSAHISEVYLPCHILFM